MTAAIDMRGHERTACRASVRWCYFNQPQGFRGTMINFSEGGACLESSSDVAPGASILMQLGEYVFACRDPKRCTWPRSLVLAEVRWCLGDPDRGEARFHFGVKYHSPG